MAVKTRMKTKRLFSVLAAMCLLLPSFSGFSVDVRAEQSTGSAATEVSDAGSIGFYQYLTAHSADPYARDPIALAAKQAALKNGAAINTVQGRQALVLTENSRAEWTVAANETALYEISLDYCAITDVTEEIRIGFSVDGQTPYTGADSVELKRIWRDDGPITVGANGNDIAPKQVQVMAWQTGTLQDYASYYSGSYVVYLEQGTHTFALTGVNDSVAIDNLTLTGTSSIRDYADLAKEYEQKGYAPAGSVTAKVQAEVTAAKSDSTIIPVYDRTSAATESAGGELNQAGRICRNTIGQSRWEKPGTWVSYTVTVPKDGLYTLVMRTRQNTNVGMSVLRDIYIDGEIPFRQAQGFVFPYSPGWTMTTFGADDGKPYSLYLTEGEHEIRFVATLNTFSAVLEQLEEVNTALNRLYRRIVMVTGISPDANRDYQLDVEIPGLMDTITQCRDKLVTLTNEYVALSGGNTSQVSVIRSNAKQLTSFIKDPDTIPARLSNFQSNISSLSDWLLSNKNQPLEIDYFMLTGTEDTVPKAALSVVHNALFGIRRFLSSFVEDYNAIGDAAAGSGETIKVWFSGSRDQAQIILDQIEAGFTPRSGISVNLSLVYQGYIEAILAGSGPDVAMDVARSYPVNLACRGALLDLSQFSTYSDVMKRFGADAAVPYTYKEKVYGLPSTQAFFMMFYRTDIFHELGISPPDTWSDFRNIIPTLQRQNYDVGLPYSTITVAGTATGGIGAKDLYATLLLQQGGTVYTDDLTSSQLGSAEAYTAFSQWIDYYRTYGFPVTYSLLTRFRSGTLPLFIASYGTYNALMGAAPEIRGLWKMVPVPGTLKEDGSIDRSTGASGTANVIFKNAHNPQSCWEFLDWWTSASVQYEYAVNLEALLGTSSRSSTSNIEAFRKLAWGQETINALETQRQSVVELAETPGSYVVSRSLDNAFRAVVYNGKNSRERFEQEVLTINEELDRKQKEFD